MKARTQIQKYTMELRSRQNTPINWLFWLHLSPWTWTNRYHKIQLYLLYSLNQTFLIRDDFNFHVVNFPYICSNIPATPADGVYVSQLKRYSASSGSPSWILLSFIESVLQMNTDMFGLYWLQVISFVFAHDLSPCVTYDRRQQHDECHL